MQNHHLTSVTTPPLKTAALKFHAKYPISDEAVVELKLQCYLSKPHLVFPPAHSITVNLLVTLFAELNKTLYNITDVDF